MVLQKNTIQNLQVAKKIIGSVTQVSFAKDSIVVFGKGICVLVPVPADMFDRLDPASPIHFSAGSSIILNSLLSEGEFSVNPRRFTFLSKTSRTEVQSNIRPENTIPLELSPGVQTRAEFTIIDTPTCAISRAINLLVSAAKLNKPTNNARDKFFCKILQNSDILFFSHAGGTIINYTTFSSKDLQHSPQESEFSFPSKIFLGRTGAQKAPENIRFRIFNSRTTVEFLSSGLLVCSDIASAKQIDISSVMNNIKTCNQRIRIELYSDIDVDKAAKLDAEKICYIISPGDNTRIEIQRNTTTTVVNTNVMCGKDLLPCRIILLYNQFLPSLSCFKQRLIMSWFMSGVNDSVKYIVLSDGDMYSIHSTSTTV